MITSGLEHFIQKGKARQHTFTFGAGGVGRIPVPKNSFIIIHHFDYWHFIDVPGFSNPGQPAVSQFGFTTTEPVTQVTWQLNGVPAIPPVIFFTSANPVQAETDFQTMLNTFFPGFTVTVLFVPLTGDWTVTVTSTAPGIAFNGLTPVVTFNPIPTGLFFITPFLGGTAGVPLTVTEFLTHKIHQLEFRSTKGRNHFLIDEPVEIFDWTGIQLAVPFFANLGGYYSKDTYLVHSDDVQINVLGVPAVLNWAVNYSVLSIKSQEFPLPVGYGTAPAPPPLATVREVIFDPLLVTQQYFPLTEKFESLPVLPGEYREQFKVDANVANALFNPQNNGNTLGNFRTYPLINIDYIQVDMNYNEFVKASNG